MSDSVAATFTEVWRVERRLRNRPGNVAFIPGQLASQNSLEEVISKELYSSQRKNFLTARLVLG